MTSLELSYDEIIARFLWQRNTYRVQYRGMMPRRLELQAVGEARYREEDNQVKIEVSRTCSALRIGG